MAKKVEEASSLLSTVIDLEALQSIYEDGAKEDHRQATLVATASQLCQEIKNVEEREEYSGDIGIDVMIRINYNINEYKAIMAELRNTSWCCCLRRAVSPQENRQAALVRIRLIEAIYIVRISAVDSRCGQLFSEVKEANDFADLLSDMSGRTAILDLKDNWESKAAVQTSLSSLMRRIEKFNHIFTSSSGKSSPDQNPKRFKNLQQYLATPPGSVAALKDYTQANRMLYDMASLGCKLLSFTAGENLDNIADMMTALKAAREEELRSFGVVLEEEGGLVGSEDDDVRGIAEFSVHYDQRVNNRLIAASSMWSELRERVSSSGFIAPYFGNPCGMGVEELALSPTRRKTSTGSASEMGTGTGVGKVTGSSKVYSPCKPKYHAAGLDSSGSSGSAGGSQHTSPATIAIAPTPLAERRATLDRSNSSVKSNSSSGSGGIMSRLREVTGRENTHEPLMRDGPSAPESFVGVAAPPSRRQHMHTRKLSDNGIASAAAPTTSTFSLSSIPRPSISYPQDDDGPNVGGRMKAKLFGSMSSVASKAADGATKAASIASQKTRKVASIAAETTSSKVARAKERLLGNNYAAIIDFDTDSSRSFY
ncbi:unnamed protein product [Symbiodinium microadriaticum]|nr:unnamed protein product [Symbiodinium microadriaticum]